MDITPLIESGTNIISGYGTGSFTIGEDRYEDSILLFPKNSHELKTTSLHTIDIDCIKSHIHEYNDVELLLIGTGEHHVPIPQNLNDLLSALGVRFDVMNTGAACRTYNVLLAEGRDIGALLITT